MTTTRVTVNITRHETAVYEFDGIVAISCVDDLIGSAEYEPVESKIHHEDIDLVELKVMST